MRKFGVVGLVLLCSVAFADMSLKLGTSFPGWDKLPTRGSLYNSAEDLIKSYARQVGHSCYSPELFVRDRSISISTALIFYEGYLPYGSRESVLLDNYDQRVSMVRRSYGSDALVVLIKGNDGIYMIIC